ncbi:MAG: DUF378 domain-containing protein [Candidatus Nanoarchaeia archaeon]|jgi:hypothetical protein|nr:DUF378 domain-containing protein [Candidatus Nanoarchaeia archaeon]|tara:strand:- start:15742 stop:15939 length:198 start_codon:yes stop_codon:yes gene_type:complete
MPKSALDWVAAVLVIVGTVNLGLVHSVNFDLVGLVLGAGNLARILYILVGLSGLYMIYVLATKNQ